MYGLVLMDECAGLTRDSLGWDSKNPWMMCWWYKKPIARKELVGFGQNPQRSRQRLTCEVEIIKYVCVNEISH